MYKKFLLLLLTQIGLIAINAEDQILARDMSFVMNLEYDLDSLLDRIRGMEEYADMALKEVTRTVNDIPQKVEKVKAAISQDDEFVKVSFNIPGLDIAKLDFEVEGKTLKGSIPVGDQTMKIEITDGVLMVSSHISYDEKTNDDAGEKHQMYEHASTQMMSLPVRIAHLKDAQVEYNNDHLVLKLPKFKEQKAETKKLSIK